MTKTDTNTTTDEKAFTDMRKEVQKYELSQKLIIFATELHTSYMFFHKMKGAKVNAFRVEDILYKLSQDFLSLGDLIDELIFDYVPNKKDEKPT